MMAMSIYYGKGAIPEERAPMEDEALLLWHGKRLYERDPDRPDNFVSASFLQSLQRNFNVPVRTFGELAWRAGALVRQLSLIVGFVSVFLWVWTEQMDLTALTIVSYASTVLAYGGWVMLMRAEIATVGGKDAFEAKGLRQRGRATIKNGLIFTLLLMTASPVFRTLTEDTSSDTIWAGSALLLLGCWAFNDYSSSKGDLVASPKDIFTNARIRCQPLSLNCAMLAAITLASRLPSHAYVFALLSLAVNVFGFFPVYERLLERRLSDRGRVFGEAVLTGTLFGGALVLLAFVSLLAAAAFVVAVLFLFVACPLWLLYLQHHKNTIHGPWDEATVKSVSA